MEYNMVVCTVCNKEMRNNQWLIERHYERNHKDKLEKGQKMTTMIPSAGTKTLFTLWGAPKKDGKNEKEKDLEENAEEMEVEGANEGEENEEERLIRGGENSAELDIDFDLGEFENASVKRILPDSENNENPVKKSKGSVVDMIFKKLESIDKKVDDLQKEQKVQEIVLGAGGERLDDVDKMFRESSTVGELENILSRVNFKKVQDVKEGVDGFYCGLCFDGSDPNWDSIPKNTAGAFKYIKSEEKSVQAANLKNLKGGIKEHLLRSKVHRQKKEILETKEKMDEKRDERKKTVGMNVFRERYTGIMQSKSRLDFEEDMLRAKMNGADVGDQNHSREFAKKLDGAIYKEMKEKMKESMNTKLVATEKKRPAGLMMDKMTPLRRTGQMHAVVIPVPENPLSQVRFCKVAMQRNAMQCNQCNDAC